jgi:hypothetical protein
MTRGSPCSQCHPPRISTPGVLWMAGPRMEALLGRLSAAENDVDEAGPLPSWVSFKWIANWCASDGSLIVSDERLAAAYRRLLDSFSAGSFQTSRVLYLGDPASARRVEPPALSNARGGITGYRMTAQFLEARAKVFSPDDPVEAWVLFNGYLAPCWIRRPAAARWLESKGYPVPTWWKQAAPSEEQTEAPLTVQPKKKQNKRGPKPKYLPEQIRAFVFEQMEHHDDFYLGDDKWRGEADLVRALIERFDMADSTAKKLLKQPLAEWREVRKSR